MRWRSLWMTVMAGSCMLLFSASLSATHLTDEEIRQRIVQQSIQSYPGNCPCPYHVDRVGRRCGARSAWGRPGGYSPVCYTNEVTNEMIEKYRSDVRA
jgi:hypothetical protein